MTKLTLLESLLREVTAIVRLPNPKLSTVVWLPNPELNTVVRQPNRKSSAVVRLQNPKFSTVVGLPNPKMNSSPTTQPKVEYCSPNTKPKVEFCSPSTEPTSLLQEFTIGAMYICISLKLWVQKTPFWGFTTFFLRYFYLNLSLVPLSLRLFFYGF